MCTNLIMPDLTNFTLKAYVGVGAKRHVIDAEVKAIAPLDTRGSLLTAREYLGSLGDKKVEVRCGMSVTNYR